MFECNEFEECEYNGNPKCYLPDGMSCPHGVTAHKLTNADRIRSMSDEELAVFLSDFKDCAGDCFVGKGIKDCSGICATSETLGIWLRQPAKEDT